jgi:hypothetical protein
VGTTLTSARASFSPENESYIKRPTIATGSFKCAKLAGGMKGSWIYANPEALVNAAVTGVFTPTARWDYWSQPREQRLASEKDRPLYDGAKPMIS